MDGVEEEARRREGLPAVVGAVVGALAVEHELDGERLRPHGRPPGDYHGHEREAVAPRVREQERVVDALEEREGRGGALVRHDEEVHVVHAK